MDVSPTEVLERDGDYNTPVNLVLDACVSLLQITQNELMQMQAVLVQLYCGNPQNTCSVDMQASDLSTQRVQAIAQVIRNIISSGVLDGINVSSSKVSLDVSLDSVVSRITDRNENVLDRQSAGDVDLF